MTTCKTCELLARRDTGDAPPWDSILRTPYWDVVHSFNSALPGWLVIVARRHMAAVDEMAEEEAVELGQLIRRVSIALREVTGCAKTYVAQFAESPDHPHVHFHIVPRMADMPDDHRGPDVFKYLMAPDDQRVGEAEMNRIALAVRRILETP
jgi:diadenosine tetraphosphate (Ap4A) HIT family hydrolase